MAIAYIGIGSNLGNRRNNINKALSCLEQLENTKIKKFSSIYEMGAVGGPNQGKFLNAACEIETDFPPDKLLKKLKEIESILGRKKSKIRWGPREMDLDILLYENLIIKKDGLTMPHPLMHKREFVLIPLSDIAPDLIHPVFKKSIARLKDELEA